MRSPRGEWYLTTVIPPGDSFVHNLLGCLSAAEQITLCVNNAKRYRRRVIRSFREKDTEAIWHRRYVKKLSRELSRLAYNKLVLINAAESINDLRVPPGNRLEKLAGSRAGQYSVRVNDQWRICFTWSASGAANVELVDYH
jgi:toxin HigB-1